MEKELPIGWVKTEIDNLFYLVYGKGLLTKDLIEDGYDVYGANGVIGKYSKYLYKDSKVIISCRGAGCGIIHRTKPFAYVTSNSIVFDEISANHINLDFIKYALESIDKDDVITGTAQPQITIQLLKNLNIPFPPLPEQQRIVAKLNTLFGHIDALKTRLDRIPQLLKDFRQKVLIQAVTGKLTEEWREGKELEEWTSGNFGDLIIDTPKNGAYYHRSLYGTGTKIIRIDCFYDGKLKDWELVQRVKIDDNDKLIYEIKTGDILVNRVNSIEYLGKCLLVDNLPEECIFESNMMRVIVNKDMISPEYTKVFLISQNGLSELRKNAKHAVNQASINQQDVKAVEIDYPPLAEQQEIVRRVESLFAKADQIEASYQKLKAKIEQLPQALLAKAFRGELVEQLPTDGDARDLLEQIKRAKEGLEKGGKGRKMKGEDELRMVAEDGARYGKK